MSASQFGAYARHRRKAFRGEAHANAKLTAQEVLDIRENYFDSIRNGRCVSQELLRSIYGVSQQAISLIVRGKTHV